MKEVLVGLLDGGVAAPLAPSVVAARAFALDETGEVIAQELPPCAGPPISRQATGASEGITHGTAVARTILAGAPEARLVCARVFDRSITTAPAVVGAALDWLVERGVMVANRSFGLRADREGLRYACAAALANGVVLVAAAPARGPAVFPASYFGVIAVCGDARCAPGEISDLEGEPADFGACPEAPGGGIGGASAAAAHATGIVAAWLATRGSGATVEEVRARLATTARFHGRERRGVRS